MTPSLVSGIGLNIPPDGRWTPDMVANTGARWVTYPILPSLDPGRLASDYAARGIVPVLVVARETLPPYSGPLTRELLEPTLSWLARTLDSDDVPWHDLHDKVVVVLGNEWDADPTPGKSPSSWILRADEVDLLLAEGATFLPRIERWGPSCSGGIASRWLEVAGRGTANRVCVNPYGRRYFPGRPTQYGLDFAPLLADYRAVLEPDQGLVFREVGAASGEIGEEQQAEYVRDAAAAIDDPWAWFCADDSQVPTFGLYGPYPALGPKPAARAFEEVTGGPMPPPQEPLPDNALLVWGQLWSLLTPADYHHDWGIESEWRKQIATWGYPTHATEIPMEYKGKRVLGRVFSKIGGVVYDGDTGTCVVIGKP